MISTFKTVLSKVSQLNSNTYFYRFSLIEPKEIIFSAGQYVILKVPSDKGPVSRLYSIASPDTSKNSFDLIVEMIPDGLASNYLLSVKMGDEMIFNGPAGMFSMRKNEKNKIFLVTGTGIAPVLSMLRSNPTISNIHLFWGLKNFSDVYFLDDLKNFKNVKICLSREKSLDIVPEVDRRFFDLGHVDGCCANQFGQIPKDFEYYLCGGRTVVDGLKQTLLSKNIPLENIVFEKF